MVENEGKCSLTLEFEDFDALVLWVKHEQANRDRAVHGKGVKIVKRADLSRVEPKRRFMVADPLRGGQFVRLDGRPGLEKAAMPETPEPVEMIGEDEA